MSEGSTITSTSASTSSDSATSTDSLARGDWEARLSAELLSIQALADEVDGEPEALLLLLRRLEELHRSIQDGAFRASLPADRGALFNLLQGMEKSGGWPYIPRLQLRTFMGLLQHGEGGSEGGPDSAMAA